MVALELLHCGSRNNTSKQRYADGFLLTSAGKLEDKITLHSKCQEFSGSGTASGDEVQAVEDAIGDLCDRQSARACAPTNVARPTLRG